MSTSTAKTKPSMLQRRPVSHKKKRAVVRQLNQQDFVSEYAKYFQAPASTPQDFQIFDLTDGASVSTTSHT